MAATRFGGERKIAGRITTIQKAKFKIQKGDVACDEYLEHPAGAVGTRCGVCGPWATIYHASTDREREIQPSARFSEVWYHPKRIATTMPRHTHTIEINATATEVFDLIHDYGCRLEWDTMLSEAEILGGIEKADVGVETRCVGGWRGLWIPMVTRYVSFRRGEVAAVELTGTPPLFEHFAATIRHRELGDGGSSVTYIYSFRAKPKLLAPVLEPIMNLALKREVAQRLQSLKQAAEQGTTTP